MKLYKYRPLNKNTLCALANNYFYFTRLPKLNDPFDSKLNLSISKDKNIIKKWIIKMSKENLTKDQIDANIEEIVNKGDDIFNSEFLTINDKISILSFSKLNSDIVIWSHYADSYKGICLEFETVKVKNSQCLLIEPNQIKTNNAYIKDGFLPVYKVIYKNTMPKKYDFMLGKDNKLVRFVLAKHKNWIYEQEYRSYLWEDIINTQKIKYRIECLTGIIFGYKSSIEDRKLVLSIIQSNYLNIGSRIKYYLTKPVAGKYAINIFEVTKNVLL